MSCQSNNATAPSPAIAPGSEGLEPRVIAEDLARKGTIDPRIPALMPGFDAPFFQAGLAGYSDAAMRIVARRHGCPMCITEALLDRTLLAGGRGFDKADLGDLHDNIPGGEEDHPLVGQIMGSDPTEMAASAVKMLEQRTRTDREYRLLAEAEHGGQPQAAQPIRLPGGQQVGIYPPANHTPASQHERTRLGPLAVTTLDPGRSFQAIDVNLACPVKKIEKKNRGGHWLTDPQGALRILEAVREAVPADVPCTVKMRRAFDDTPEMADNFEVIFARAYEIGYSWITVHARTVEQKYLGPSRWTFLRDLVKRHPNRIVFGSGDVWEVGDIFKMIAYTGVHAVSVARGCIGNPWIFRQARDLLAGREPQAPTLAEQRAALLTHFELSLAVTRRFRHGEETTSKMMRKFGIKFAKHHPQGDDVKRQMISVSSSNDWKGVIDTFYPVVQ